MNKTLNLIVMTIGAVLAVVGTYIWTNGGPGGYVFAVGVCLVALGFVLDLTSDRFPHS